MTPGARPPAAITVPLLIGRDEALGRIARSVQSPYSGPMAILIEGPAGIGKTSLLRAAVAVAEDSGARVLYARPVEAEATYAYATLADLLAPHLDAAAERLSAAQILVLRTALGRSASGTGEPSESAKDGPDGPVDAQLVAQAVLAAFRALAARGAILVAVDDASWADVASRDALAFTMRRLEALPIRVLIAQRVDAPGGPLPLGLAEAARPVPVERVWLEPLSMGALHQMLRSATGATFTRPTLLRIHELSGGNPFYALELAQAVVAEGAVVRPGQDLPIPTSLRELIGARLARLPKPTRRLLLTAALSARPSAGILKARAGKDPVPVLRPAIDTGLVRFEGSLVTFGHPLYASMLVAEASPRDVQEAHRWLGEAGAEDMESRARHLALATDGLDASVGQSLVAAAAMARRRGAPGVAANLADLAVERTPIDDPRRAEAALAAADAWFVAGDPEAARTRMIALLPTVEGTLRARALVLLGLIAWYSGTGQQATAVLLPALKDARGDRLLSGLIHYHLSIYVNFDIAAARRHAVASAELLDGTEDKGHLAAALLGVFHWTWALGRRPPMSILKKGLAIEMEGLLTDRLTSPGIWWAGIGRMHEARDRFRHMLDFDLIQGQYANAANLLTRLAEVEIWSDDWVEGRRQAVAAVEMGLETGAGSSEMALRALALVDAYEGYLDRAGDAAMAGIERTEHAASPVLAAAWLGVAALVAASRGDPSTVEEMTGRAWRHLREVGYREPLRLDPSPERVEALALLGLVEEAAVELDELAARHRMVPKPWAAAAIARGRARIALARDDPEDAVATTDIVSTGEPSEWSRFDAARVLVVRAEALRQLRSRREASEVLQRAGAIFEALGASAWVSRVAQDAARLGLVRSAGLALTPTEARVARLAGDGLSTRDVATELGISPRTVETHLASIYGKLGVSSRAELGRAMVGRQEAPRSYP